MYYGEFFDLELFEKDNPDLIKLFSFHASQISKIYYSYYLIVNPDQSLIETDREFIRIDYNAEYKNYKVTSYSGNSVFADVLWFIYDCKVQPYDLNLDLFDLA